MRVMIVGRASYALPASQGGVDAYALRTGLFLVPRGHDVTLVGQGRPGPAFGRIRFVRVPTNRQVTSRFRLTYFAKGFLLNVACVLAAARHLRRHRDSIDVVHSNSNLGTLVLKRLFPEKPLVYTLHDPLLEWRGSATPPAGERLIRIVNNGILERLALRRADHVVAVSSEIKAQAERVGGIEGKISLLYPFVSVGPVPGSAAPGSPAGSPVPTPFILSVGAQTGRKRFDLLIRALALDGPELRLVLVGNGPERARLQRTAAECGLADRVVFLDQLSDAELSRLYQYATAYAMVSEREGYPATLVEAALHGTPTLYFTEGPTPDLERDTSDFFRVVHSVSEREIARAIEGVCSWSERHEKGRSQIARWAGKRFPSPESVAGELSHVYRQVVGPPSNGPGGAPGGLSAAPTMPRDGAYR